MFIIAKDWALRAGVRAELREQGIEALGMESADDAGRMLAQGTVPSALVLEATADGPAPSLESLARSVPAVVVASRTETARMPSNAAAVLYRPVQVADVVTCVKNLLRGEPA